MIFSKWIKEKDTIGVTAPSYGITDETDRIRFKNGVKNFADKNYKVIMTDNVFTADEIGLSSDKVIRAGQFNELIKNKDVTAVISAAGGNFLMEMLPYVDYEAIKKNPKWVQGYSDNTAILYSITTLCDVATVYGCNFGDFGMKEWELPVERAFNILAGKENVQTSFDYYEDEWHKRETGFEGYCKDKPVCWVNGRGEEKIAMRGRLIGGCIDVISLAIAGTRFDGTLQFTEKYRDDGILWYLESFDINIEEMVLHLWRLKEIGYFKYASGFVFGRPMLTGGDINMTYEQAVMRVLEDLNVPVIFGADIGHKGPQFSMVNGALATVECEGGKGKVSMEFK